MRSRKVGAPFFLLLAAIVSSGCMTVPAKGSHELAGERAVRELYFIRAGHVPLFPWVKWIESHAILHGAGASADRRDLRSMLGCEKSLDLEHRSGRIEWRIVHPCRSRAGPGDDSRTRHALERATEYMVDNYLPTGRYVIRLYVVPDDLSVKYGARRYYLTAPGFDFLIGSSAAEDADLWLDVVNGIGVVFHELFHYSQGLVADPALSAEALLVREEIQAYAAEECGKAWFVPGFPDVELTLGVAEVGARELRNIHERYGASAVGRIIAGQALAGGLPAAGRLRVSIEELPRIMGRCEQLLRRDFDVSPYWPPLD